MKALLVVSTLLASFTAAWCAHTECPCEDGWIHNDWDDSCNRVFPFRGKYNVTVGNQSTGIGGDGTAVPVTYADAVAYCERHRGWVPTILNSTTQRRFLMDLVRTHTEAGSSWWIGVQGDPSKKTVDFTGGSSWQTPKGRKTGFSFDWDTYRKMPRMDQCVVMHMIGDKDHVGGNNRMITVDCQERHHVVCTKPRVETDIAVFDRQPPGRIEVIYGLEKVVSIGGAFIPEGTQLSMQTTDENFPETRNRRTHCKQVFNLDGASAPVVLNVSRQKFEHPNCMTGKTDVGTCREAFATFPADWPWMRGAQYSFCFFVPVPYKIPEVFSEWTTEYQTEAYVEVVQKGTDFLRDVCLRRAANVNLFYGEGKLGDAFDHDPSTSGNPWYFDSPVERGSVPGKNY